MILYNSRLGYLRISIYFYHSDLLDDEVHFKSTAILWKSDFPGFLYYYILIYHIFIANNMNIVLC